MTRALLRLLLRQQRPGHVPDLFAVGTRPACNHAQVETVDVKDGQGWQFQSPALSRVGPGEQHGADQMTAGQMAARQESASKHTDLRLLSSGEASFSGRSTQPDKHARTCDSGLQSSRHSRQAWQDDELGLKQALRAASTLTEALNLLEGHSQRFSAQLSAQGMASIMRLSSRRLPYHLVLRRENVMQRLTACLESGSTSLSGRDIVTFAYSLARLGHARPRIYSALEACALRGPPGQFCPRDLEQLVWGFARARFHAPVLLSRLQPSLVDAMPEMEPWQISNIVSGLAGIGHPAGDVFQAAASEAMVRMHQFPARSLASLIDAFAEAQHSLPGPLATMVERRAMQVISDFSPSQLTTLLEAFVALGHDAADLLLAVPGTMQPSELSPVDMARLLRACTGQVRAAGGWRKSKAPSCSALLRKSSRLRAFLSAGASGCVEAREATDLVDALWAVVTAKLPLPDVFARAEPLCREFLPNLDSDSAARMAWAFSAAATRGTATREAAARALTAVDNVLWPNLQSMELRTMAILLEAHALVGYQQPLLFEAVSLQIQIRTTQLEPEEASQMLWAVSQVHQCSQATAEHLAQQLAETSRPIEASSLARAVWAYVAAGCDKNGILGALAAKASGLQFDDHGLQQLQQAEALTGFNFLKGQKSLRHRNRLDGSDRHAAEGTSDVPQLAARAISLLQSMRELGVEAWRAAGYSSSPHLYSSDIMLRSEKAEEFVAIILGAEAFTVTDPRRLMGEACMRARVLRAVGKMPVLIQADELREIQLPSELWRLLYSRYQETRESQKKGLHSYQVVSS